MSPEERRAHLIRARELFNAGDYWAAHEALETSWRSIISDDAAPAWQGLIQAALALLHLPSGYRYGVAVVGGVGLDRLSGLQRSAVAGVTVSFSAHLAQVLVGEFYLSVCEYL